MRATIACTVAVPAVAHGIDAAESAYKAGMFLAAQRDVRGARALFERAWALTPHWRFAFNVARTAALDGDLAGAERWIWRAEGVANTDAERAKTVAERAVVEKQLLSEGYGRLRVSVVGVAGKPVVTVDGGPADRRDAVWVVWTVISPAPPEEGALAVARLASGGSAISGYTGGGLVGGKLSGASFYHNGRDANGNVIWARTEGAGIAHTVAVLGDGGLLAAGEVPTSGGGDAQVVRADAWGYPTCTASAGCAAKGINVCIDNNPCTADVCSPSTGACTASPLPQGSVCGAGLRCGAGGCGP